MDDVLKCQLCDKVIENHLPLLHDHISTHIGNYEEDAEREGQDVDEWVLSYFDSIEEG